MWKNNLEMRIEAYRSFLSIFQYEWTQLLNRLVSTAYRQLVMRCLGSIVAAIVYGFCVALGKALRDRTKNDTCDHIGDAEHFS